MFDSKNLYIAARCHEAQPERTVANELRRDSMTIFQNDNFGVILDTFKDQRNGFLFYTNPVGGFADSYITDERDSNRDWNTVWEVRTQRQENSWTVEMAIPFKSLRYKPGNPQVWGINFRRIVRWENEYSYLIPIPRSYGSRGIQKVSSAATLVGIETPGGGANAEIKPYALGMLQTDLRVVPPINNKPELNAGVDAKLGVTRGLTADFTYRTDFAQVENDEQQVNLSRFDLFYPEKRHLLCLHRRPQCRIGWHAGSGNTKLRSKIHPLAPFLKAGAPFDFTNLTSQEAAEFGCSGKR